MSMLTSLFRRIITHPLARGSAIVLVGSTLANIGAYAYHLIVGRMLGPVSYGELASLFSFSYLLNVPSLVLQTVLTKYIAEFRAKHEVGKAKSLSLITTSWLMGITAVGGLIVLPFMNMFADFLHISHPVSIFFMYLTSALWLVTVVQTSLLQGFQLFTAAMLMTNITTILRLVGGIIGATYGVVATVIAGFITGFVGLIVYFFPLRFVYAAKALPSGISTKEFAGFSAPSLMTLLSITSLYSTDILLAKHFLSPIEAGYYAALSIMGKVVYFASSSVSYVLFPVVAERTKKKSDSKNLVVTALLAVAVVSFGITAGYLFFPNIALGLLFGSSYYPASPYLWVMGVFLSFYSLSYVLTMTMLGRGNVGVWKIVSAGAIAQIVVITLFHENIVSIISANCYVVMGLFVSLLLYYRNGRQ